MSQRFTMAVPESDTEFNKWRKQQKNISRSIRLVVKNFISQYGEGDVEDVLIGTLKPTMQATRPESGSLRQKAPPVQTRASGNEVNDATDEEGFAKDLTLDEILNSSDGSKEEVDPMSFMG